MTSPEPLPFITELADFLADIALVELSSKRAARLVAELVRELRTPTPDLPCAVPVVKRTVGRPKGAVAKAKG